MESRTYLKNLNATPKKIRFFLPAVKKMKPKEALNYLFYVPNKGAQILHQAISSAVSNAKNALKTSEDQLKFRLLTIEEGRKLKRFKPGGRGGVRPRVRRASHIKIILEAEKGLVNEPAKPIKEVEVKEENKSTVKSKKAPVRQAQGVLSDSRKTKLQVKTKK